MRKPRPARQAEFERMRRRLLYAVLALVSLMVVGTLGFSLFAREDQNLIDSFYMTVITLTTVGYGETIQLEGHPWGQLFASVLLLGGMGIVAYSVVLFATFLIEGHVFNVFARRRMQKRIETMSGHYIVCGTTNRAETAQGFFVKYGDGGVDIEPLTPLYKNQVYQLARHLSVPEEILKRTPSPDTYSFEVSDKDFYFCLPYDTVDMILYAQEHSISKQETAAALGLEMGQLERAWKDLERKQDATRHLRDTPPVPDLGI